MRESKYVGLVSEGWVCVKMVITRVQPAFKQKKVGGKSVRSKYPGHQQYGYVFDRLTSDAKAIKSITLNAVQVRQVLDGKHTVEYFAEKKEAKRSLVVKDRVSYSFCD